MANPFFDTTLGTQHELRAVLLKPNQVDRNGDMFTPEALSRAVCEQDGKLVPVTFEPLNIKEGESLAPCDLLDQGMARLLEGIGLPPELFDLPKPKPKPDINAIYQEFQSIFNRLCKALGLHAEKIRAEAKQRPLEEFDDPTVVEEKKPGA